MKALIKPNQIEDFYNDEDIKALCSEFVNYCPQNWSCVIFTGDIVDTDDEILF